MSLRRSAVVVMCVGIAFGAGWVLRGSGPRAPQTAPDHAADDDARAELARLQREIARLRRVSIPAAGATRTVSDVRAAAARTPTGPSGAAVPPAARTADHVGIYTPPVPVAGLETALSHTDWRLLAGILAAHRVTAAEVDLAAARSAVDKAAPDGPVERAEWLREGELLVSVDLAGRLDRNEYDAFAHPAVVVNLAVAMLDAAGHPASASVRARLAELAATWTMLEEQQGAEAQAATDVPFLRELMNRVTAHEQFLHEVFALLDPEQRRVLRPPGKRHLLVADVFSAAPILSEVSDVLYFISGVGPDGEFSLGDWMADVAGLGSQPPDAYDELRRVGREWAAGLSDEEQPFDPTGDRDLLSTAFARAVAASQARLHDRWMNEVPLSEESRAKLRERQELRIIQAPRPSPR